MPARAPRSPRAVRGCLLRAFEHASMWVASSSSACHNHQSLPQLRGRTEWLATSKRSMRYGVASSANSWISRSWRHVERRDTGGSSETSDAAAPGSLVSAGKPPRGHPSTASPRDAKGSQRQRSTPPGRRLAVTRSKPGCSPGLGEGQIRWRSKRAAPQNGRFRYTAEPPPIVR